MGDAPMEPPVRHTPLDEPSALDESSAVTTPNVADSPLDAMTAFFLGRVSGNGVFEDRSGRPRRTFMLAITGRLEGAALVLDEDFTYDDGARERRTWRFERDGPTAFKASAADCVGPAIGEITPGRWRMRYGFMLRLRNRLVPVDFDDRLYVVGPRIAINRATMRKWGIKLGTVLIVYERETALATGTPGPTLADPG